MDAKTLPHSAERQSGTIAKELPKHLEQMSPADRAKVVEAMKKDSRFDRFLARAASIGGAAWDGWEKGVNGSLKWMKDGVVWAATMIGESAAIMVHGKEWELLDYSVQKLKPITEMVYGTADFVKISGKEIYHEGAIKSVMGAYDYWKDVWVKKTGEASKMSAEDIARTTGKLAGGIAVGAVTGYALKAAQTANVLNQEVFTGTSLVGKTADGVVKQAAQWSMEYAGGRRLTTAQRQELSAIQEMTGIYKKMSAVKAEMASVEKEIAHLTHLLKSGHNRDIAIQLERAHKMHASLEQARKRFSDSLQSTGVHEIEKKIEQTLSKEGVNEGAKAVGAIASDESKKKDNPKLAQVERPRVNATYESIVEAAIGSRFKAAQIVSEASKAHHEILRELRMGGGEKAIAEARTKLGEQAKSLSGKIDDLIRIQESIYRKTAEHIPSDNEMMGIRNLEASLISLRKARSNTHHLERQLAAVNDRPSAHPSHHSHPSHQGGGMPLAA